MPLDNLKLYFFMGMLSEPYREQARVCLEKQTWSMRWRTSAFGGKADIVDEVPVGTGAGAGGDVA